MDEVNMPAEEQYPEMLQELVGELGIGNLPQEKQEELIIKMTEVLLKRIFLETMEALDENGRVEYDQLMKGEASPDQVEAFFKQKIANYDAMVQQVVEEFKAEMRTVKAE